MKETEKRTDQDRTLDRRFFVGTAAAVAGATWVACTQPAPSRAIEPGLVKAPDGPLLKAGLIGCGGRGTGAALNFLAAGPSLQITAMADLFSDRLEGSRANLKEKAGAEVEDGNCFVGFDAYKKLIDSDVDIVIQATPPHFRPEHVEAAISARKHVFMEKPVAVDPAGVRSILKTAEKADAYGVSIATGTQYRHQKSYIETYNRVAAGDIGDILAARAYSLRGQLWYKEPQEEWTEMEAMLRDWVNWNWLSGDHIVEQHIHGLDVINWFTGSRPDKAVGTGGRMRRVTGDQYDFFTVDYELESGIHFHTMCRQMDGCTNNISTFVVGSKGYTNCRDTVFSPSGEVIWKYEGENDNSPYVQEHIDLITAIRADQHVNEAPLTAVSTMKAIMGRMSAYTGKEVTWQEAIGDQLRLGPQEYAMGPVGMERLVPVPGEQKQA